MHLFIKAPKFAACSHCNKETLPHTVCPYCGFYKGKEVVNTLKKVEKKEKKHKEHART